ncbi:MAG: hypothetical protein M1839_005401 [Geoglossum umbratile]|nr:MAG: hypothetical protein M1839_005401 [Geoglossum umbratile]
MSHPEVAGFDPVFWLHHANIDRILAIWQGMNNPNEDDIAWWDSLVFPLLTYVEPEHEPETPDSPLAPFRKAFNGDETVWWTSNDVRDHTKLGYDYPETKEASATDDPVTSLRKCANIEVGWVGDFGNKNTPLLDHPKKQVTEQAPALPKTIVVGVIQFHSHRVPDFGIHGFSLDKLRFVLFL